MKEHEKTVLCSVCDSATKPVVSSLRFCQTKVFFFLKHEWPTIVWPLNTSHFFTNNRDRKRFWDELEEDPEAATRFRESLLRGPGGFSSSTRTSSLCEETQSRNTESFPDPGGAESLMIWFHYLLRCFLIFQNVRDDIRTFTYKLNVVTLTTTLSIIWWATNKEPNIELLNPQKVWR